MKKILQFVLAVSIFLFFSACDSMESIHDNNISSPDVPVEPDITIISDTNVSSSNTQTDSIVSDVVFGQVKTKIPTLVVIMNWQNITEDDPLVWYNKIFNLEANSVDRWYYDATDANIEFVPIHETSGTTDDGVITVNMGVNHPGSDSGHEVQFRDTYLGKAMYDVDANVDFSKYDVNHDGSVSQKELQVIFIIAGGEESYNQIARNAIWAHAWSFDESNPLILDGVQVISDTGDTTNDGWYARFGAVHDYGFSDAHKATVGIIAHELGHALFALRDYYPLDSDNIGSGLGYYDIMSGGAWAKKSTDAHYGDTPVQYSAYNKIDTGIDLNLTVVTSSSAAQDITIKCSSNDLVKLTTTKSNEYFLLECRDSARIDSDKSFKGLDSAFTDNKLFALIYQVDTNKLNNNESGTQTSAHHYQVRLIESDTRDSLTFNTGVTAEYSDAYTDGEIASSSKVRSYDGATRYNIDAVSSNYSNRTMTFKITQ